jgi:hypothetical protein
MSEKVDQTLTVFLLDSGDAARRLVKTVELAVHLVSMSGYTASCVMPWTYRRGFIY